MRWTFELKPALLRAVLSAVYMLFVFFNVAPLSSAKAQNGSWTSDTNSGRNVTGPFHRPLIVRNEYGTDDRALLVYRDKAVEMYVPDVTDQNGYGRLQELKHFGTFMTMLYMYDPHTERTSSWFTSVDALKRTISLRTDPFAKPAVFKFDEAPYAINHAILNVVNVMQHEMAVQHIR